MPKRQMPGRKAGTRAMRVLLGIDNSKFSAAAMRMVLAQNQAGKTAVRVLHVVEPLNLPFYPELTAPYPASLEDIRKGREKAGRALVERVVSQLLTAGFQADGVLRVGDAAATVLDVADKWRADLIVLGSHGWKGLSRFLLGSVSDHVARHANCSVEIVRVPRRRKITRKSNRLNSAAAMEPLCQLQHRRDGERESDQDQP